MSDSEAVEQGAAGEPLTADQLLAFLYDELRKLAALKIGREGPGQTLQATALVHEAWLRLGGDRQPAWQNRAHFFAAAAEAMRRILIDRAGCRGAQRRGECAEKVELEGLEIPMEMDEDQLLAMHEALDRLAENAPAKAELVKLRFFVGLTLEEAAEVLGVSVGTAKRQWAYARAWLYREISGQR